MVQKWTNSGNTRSANQTIIVDDLRTGSGKAYALWKCWKPSISSQWGWASPGNRSGGCEWVLLKRCLSNRF